MSKFSSGFWDLNLKGLFGFDVNILSNCSSQELIPKNQAEAVFVVYSTIASYLQKLVLTVVFSKSKSVCLVKL